MSGNPRAVEWFFRHGFQNGSEIIVRAARSGNVVTMDRVWDRDLIDDRDVARLWENAIRSRSLHLLRWLIAHDITMGARTTPVHAAFYGYLDVLRFLRRHQCPWDFRTIEIAIGSGHLEIVEWAIENGCPWTAEERLWCLKNCPPRYNGIRRWIEERWPEEPPEGKV